MRIPVVSILAAAFFTAALQAAPLDDLQAAAKKLSVASNYTCTVKPAASAARPTPIEWQAERDRWIIGRRVDDAKPWSVSDGKRRYVRGKNDRWVRDGSDGAPVDPVNLRPTAAVDELNAVVGALKNVRREGDAIVGELAPEFVAKQLTFREGPPKNASGSARFWLKDGALLRYQVNRKGTIRVNEDTQDYDATIEIGFSKVGATKAVIPDDVKELFKT